VRHEIARVDFVHRRKIVYVRKKHSGLYDTLDGGARGFHDALQIFEHAFSLRGHVALDDLLRVRVERNLSGKENKSVRLDGL